MKQICKISVFFVFFFLCLASGSCAGSNESTLSFTLSRSDLSFTADVGYANVSEKIVKIENTGDSELQLNIDVSGKNSDKFTVNPSEISIASGAAGNFSVAPKKELGEGKYSAVVTVSGKGVESQTVNVNFNVKKPVVTEPEEELHVYLAFGQSNMQGPGEVRTKDKENVSDRWKILNVVAGIYAKEDRVKSEWYKAVPPLIIPDSGSPNYLGIPIGLGPSDHFGRTMTAGTPEHITIGVIAAAHGDLALASFHKTQGAVYFGSGSTGKETNRPSTTETQGWTRYTGAGYTSIYDAIIKNAKLAQEQGGIIKGIIFHQGESGRGLTYTTWHEMLKEIYNDMLNDLGLPPDSIPILLGQLWNAGTGPGGYLNTNNTLIKAVIPNAWVISTAGLTEGRTGQGQPDNTHFGAADLEGLGIRYGEKMLELVY